MTGTVSLLASVISAVSSVFRTHLKKLTMKLTDGSAWIWMMDPSIHFSFESTDVLDASDCA